MTAPFPIIPKNQLSALIASSLMVGLMAATSARAGLPAFSGISAKADSAETAITNPAGMSRLEERATTLRAIVAQGIGEFEVDESQSTEGGDPDSSSSPVLIPLGYYVRQFDERIRGGISLTVPSGFGSDYGGDWAGRYYTDSYALVCVALTPSVSYRVNEHWSFGAGVGINYTLSESEVAINNQGSSDGKLKAELDGVGTSFTLSTLWEISERSRIGLVYTTESTSDLEGDIEYKNLGPVLESLRQQGVLPKDVSVENTMPQRVNAGIYHELVNGGAVAFDVIWVDFSEFGTASVSLDGTELAVDESGTYKDFWGAALGYSFPASDGWRYSVGAFHVTSPTGDERSLAMPLDRMWGIGAGVQLPRSKGSLLDINVNLIDYGNGEVDTGPSSARGRVVGETKNPYLLALDASYHF